ncbi:MAG: hypothetical protein GXP31_13185, partial [Kiritimatiellaeota bacterium]|nr:hypothetical protein [Kiritimatiellota bacterium]
MKTSAPPRPDLADGLRETPVSAAGPNFMGLQILPVRTVSRKADTVPIPVLADLPTRETPVDRAPGAAYPRIDYRTTELEYACRERGLETLVDDSQAADVAGEFDAELDAARSVYFNILREQEIRIAAIAFSASNFSGYTGAVSTVWSDAAAKIYDDLRDALRSLLNNVGGAIPAGVEICLAVSDVLFGHMEGNTQLNNKRGGGAGARKRTDDKTPLDAVELARIIGYDQVF